MNIFWSATFIKFPVVAVQNSTNLGKALGKHYEARKTFDD